MCSLAARHDVMTDATASEGWDDWTLRQKYCIAHEISLQISLDYSEKVVTLHQ